MPTIPTATQNGLPAYTGPWTTTQVRHLLRRATFAPSPAMIEQALNLGYEATLDLLFANNPLPDPPVNYFDGSIPNLTPDPDVDFGETWIDVPFFPDPDLELTQTERNRILRNRVKSMQAWSILQMHKEEISIVEKMTLFWHNHFVVAEMEIAQLIYQYSTLLRSYALGNFRELTKDITINSGMLRYLDGKDNTKNSPNENYARELLELFTVGKGALAGTDDYTTFTEQDVVEMAKVLTGWKVPLAQNGDPLIPFFNSNKHSEGDKFLSHRFDNAIIAENGELEYRDLIDVIFEQEACSLHISRALYRWFIHYEIDEVIELEVIEPMAQLIRNSNYEIAPALRNLLGSQFFFDKAACMIKNPLDFVLSLSKGIGLDPSYNATVEQYIYALFVFDLVESLDLTLFEHPDVAGWKPYYQEPLFYRMWINTYTYPIRNTLANGNVLGGSINNQVIPPPFPVMDITAQIPNNLDPNELIDGIAHFLFPYQITEEQKDYLKDILIPGLPDFEWTVEYSAYLDDPNNQETAQAVESKLRDLYAAMVQMPEFQLM